MKTEIPLTDRKSLSGILCFDKPKGITSFAALKTLKKKTGVNKIGHAGTLDPLATGLLLVCVGKATKLARFFENLDKEYITKMHLGKTTDTYDAEGQIMSESEPNVSLKELESVINNYKGKIEQVPPQYSAIKIKGKPAYKYARQGNTVEIKPRDINIYELEVLNFELPYCDIRIKCSKGTYIRTLVHDIGIALKCGAYVKELRRIAIGDFNTVKCVKAESNSDDIINSVIPLNRCVDFLPCAVIKNEYKTRLLNGIKPDKRFIKEFPGINNDYCRLIDEDKNLLAIAYFNRENGFKFEKVFSSEYL